MPADSVSGTQRFIWPSPDARRSALCFTHDVDHGYREILSPTYFHKFMTWHVLYFLHLKFSLLSPAQRPSNMRLITVPFLLIGAQLASAALPLLPGQIKNLVVFGDSYSVQNVGGGRIQWVDWLASKDYANLKLYDFAKSGATCSQALTPRTYPAIVEDELPEFLAKQRNGTVPRLTASSTLYAIWIGTNDLGPGCLLTGEQTRGVSVVDTSNCVRNLVKQLYKNGGRNFVVLNVSPFPSMFR